MPEKVDRGRKELARESRSPEKIDHWRKIDHWLKRSLESKINVRRSHVSSRQQEEQREKSPKERKTAIDIILNTYSTSILHANSF